MTNPPDRARQPAREPEGSARGPEPIDLERLAEKVYRLMLADLRLERARGVRPDRRQGAADG